MEAGVLKNSCICDRCQQDMHLRNKHGGSDLYIWYCGKTTNGVPCNSKKSIRYDSWFRKMNLSIEKIFRITHQLLNNFPTEFIIQGLRVSSKTLTDWGQYIRQVMMMYLNTNLPQLGGPGVVVEIAESKFGKGKYHRGHQVEEQWVFGAYERGSGRIFLIAVPDRKAETLIPIIQRCILPGSTIYSGILSAYNTLGAYGYDHHTVNHSQCFVNPLTLVHINGIVSTWRHVKVSIPQYNRHKDISPYLYQHMFNKLCQTEGVTPFIKFMEVLRDIN